MQLQFLSKRARDLDKGHQSLIGQPQNKDQLQTPEWKGGNGEDAYLCFYSADKDLVAMLHFIRSHQQ